VLQALAERGRLARIDLMSTVSGGGYIAGFLGRLYTRMRDRVADPAARVRSILTTSGSAEMWWLRAHARYLTGAGITDLEADIGTIWRNLLAVHIWVATLVIAVEAVLYALAYQRELVRTTHEVAGTLLGVRWSPWWWVPASVAILGLVPAWLGFWLSPKPGTRAAVSIGGLLLWLAALAAAILALATTQALAAPLLAIVALLAAWAWQEIAQWGVSTDTELAARGAIARNRLTRGAGIALGLFLLSLAWALIDTLADYVARSAYFMSIPAIMALIAAALPSLRALVAQATSAAAAARAAAAGSAKLTRLWQTTMLGAVGLVFFVFAIFALDALTHRAFQGGLGGWLLASALLVSIAVGRATDFVNLSSLQSLYAARLGRTYLGAANEARINGEDAAARDVDTAHPDDDLFLHDYHPERAGGPLHLINVCVNQTVDVTSGRQLKEDRGLPLCLGPAGASVGLRYHALWDAERTVVERVRERMLRAVENAGTPRGEERSALRALPVAPDPEAFHVLASRDRPTVPVEALRLSQWIAISGAAFTPGEGRATSLPLAYLLGLLNVRLGYWWDSRIDAGDRPGQYPPSLWQVLKSLPGRIFRTQRTILNEWRGYFPGPSHRFWYLSDGGHYDNTALYELLRRRLPLIIAVDAGHDPDYGFDDLAIVIRTARLDFGATFDWLDPGTARASGIDGWDAFTRAPQGTPIPPQVRDWLEPDAIGPLEGIKRAGPYAAALARIDYQDGSDPSWLVLLKACLPTTTALPLDVTRYGEQNASFPNQSSIDQFFGDDQWESYRMLGMGLGGALFTSAARAGELTARQPSPAPRVPR